MYCLVYLVRNATMDKNAIVLLSNEHSGCQSGLLGITGALNRRYQQFFFSVGVFYMGYEQLINFHSFSEGSR